jgi:leucyl aminopeptidase
VQQAFRAAAGEGHGAEGRQEAAKDYPLLMAVARASMGVARHRRASCASSTRRRARSSARCCFAGKGLTYDTGGADLKTGGHMAGMSRDKGGAGRGRRPGLAAAKLGARACA